MNKRIEECTAEKKIIKTSFKQMRNVGMLYYV